MTDSKFDGVVFNAVKNGATPWSWQVDICSESASPNDGYSKTKRV
jgi:hypothetical protein